MAYLAGSILSTTCCVFGGTNMRIDTSILFEDLHYTVDVEYDNGTDECDCGDDYCRCSTIVNTRVEDVPYAKLAEKIAPESLHLKYCVERILRHFKPLRGSDNWNIEVEGGYYGEELGEVRLNKDVAETISNLLMSLEDASDNEIVETSLQVEYGFVLPTLKDKTWTLERVPTAELDLGNKHHAGNLDEERIVRYRITDEQPIIGLLLFLDKKYRVIDGYHRITAAKKDKKQVVWAIVGR